jgi:Winged helix-turn helix
MRENRTSGSTGGRWPDVAHGEAEHAPSRGKPEGLSPPDLPPTRNQRPTSLVNPQQASHPSRIGGSKLSVARPPSVFVRDLSGEAASQLRRISDQSKVFARRQRAQIVLASDSKVAAPQIAQVLQTDENQVRRVIAEFNADGMASLNPRMGGGRPRRITEADRDVIRAVVLARPGDLGEPFQR